MRKIFLKLGGSLAGSQVRAMADGKYGPGAKWLYDLLAGNKRVIGMLFVLLAIALGAMGHPMAATINGSVAAFTISVGVLDANFRDHSAYMTQAPFDRFMRDHFANVAAVLGALITAFTTCGAQTAAMLAHLALGSFHLTCPAAGAIATVLLAWGGWAWGETKLAAPPER